MALSVAFAAAFCGLAAEASASVISSGSNLSNVYVAAGSTLSGAFNVSGGIAGSHAVSGSVTATFTDYGDSYLYLGSSSSTPAYQRSSVYIDHYNSHTYNCGPLFYIECTVSTPVYYTDNYYTQTVTRRYMNPAERASLTLGATTATATSPYFDLGSSPAGSGPTTASWNGAGYDRYQTLYNNHRYGYSGVFSATVDLDATALDDLNADGLLDFTIGSVFGDFKLYRAVLTATVMPNPVSSVLPGTVGPPVHTPEPGTLVLAAAALGGLALRGRRRQ